MPCVSAHSETEVDLSHFFPEVEAQDVGRDPSSTCTVKPYNEQALHGEAEGSPALLTPNHM